MRGNTRESILEGKYFNTRDQATTDTPQISPDEYANFIAESLEKPVKQDPPVPPLPKAPKGPHPKFEITPFTVDEVKQQLDLIDPSKATGPDRPPGRLVRDLSPVLCESFTALINRCLSEKRFPKPFKVARVTPIWKQKGSISVPSSYTPVSVLPVLALAFERLVVSRLNSFFSESKAYDDRQFGFSFHPGTTEALLYTTNEIIKHVKT
jgi:hypothetical protein